MVATPQDGDRIPRHVRGRASGSARWTPDVLAPVEMSGVLVAKASVGAPSRRARLAPAQDLRVPLPQGVGGVVTMSTPEGGRASRNTDSSSRSLLPLPARPDSREHVEFLAPQAFDVIGPARSGPMLGVAWQYGR